MSALRHALHLPDPDATAALGAWLAPRLVPGDVLLLEGPIGSGKTHLARALIQTRLAAHDAVEDVPSPTFTLVQTYAAGDREIWHADLYRLTDGAEIVELGLETAFESAICLVEWPERLGAACPANALTLRFDTPAGGQGRVVTFTGPERWRGLVESLAGQDFAHG